MAETLSAWRLESSAEPAVLIASELATNAVRHAGTEFTVSLRRAASEVRIEVADGVIDREPRVGRADGRAEVAGGIGLVIVERLADAWGVEKRRSGKSVWVRLAVEPGRRPAVAEGGVAGPAAG